MKTTSNNGDDDNGWNAALRGAFNWDQLFKPVSDEISKTAAQLIPEVDYESPAMKAAIVEWDNSEGMRQLQRSLAKAVDLPDLSYLFESHAEDLPSVNFSRLVDPAGFHGFSTGDISPEFAKLAATVSDDVAANPDLQQAVRHLAGSFKMPDSVMQSLRETFISYQVNSLSDAMRVAGDMPEVNSAIRQIIGDHSLEVAKFATTFSGESPVTLREMDRSHRFVVLGSTLAYLQESVKAVVNSGGGGGDPIALLVVLTFFSILYVIAILGVESTVKEGRGKKPGTREQ